MHSNFARTNISHSTSGAEKDQSEIGYGGASGLQKTARENPEHSNFNSYKQAPEGFTRSNYFVGDMSQPHSSSVDIRFPFDYRRDGGDMEEVNYNAATFGRSAFELPEVPSLDTFSFQQYGANADTGRGSFITEEVVRRPRPQEPAENLGGDSPSQSIGLYEGVLSSRKRGRKSDHAVPGDEGDNELKNLALQASQIPFPDLAARIRALEKDEPGKESIAVFSSGKDISKERQRQIFGMVWLFNSCEQSPTAVVPRNRIYARYVQICADNSLKPLSPASFGKLVRILFPSLTTRRLGMRGQSKYHYCGIKLIGDQSNQAGISPMSNSPSVGVDSPQSIQNPATPSRSESPAITNEGSSLLYTPVSLSFSGENIYLLELAYIPNLLPLLEASLNSVQSNNQIVLPSIYPYLPQDTDYDIADTLYSLYKVHCSSIFEFLRYMQVEKLLSTFSSFNGILTVPVFKLYTEDSVTSWVDKCDSIMFKNMVKMLTKIHMQLVPESIIQQLKEVSKHYVDCLTQSLQNKVSKKFLMMKIKNARKFSLILGRLVKVLESGGAVARILESVQDKQAMISDWLKLDLNEIILREVPWSKENVDVLLDIFTNSFVQILRNLIGKNAHEIMHSIAELIIQVPSHIVGVNPRFFTLVFGNLFTTCLREISLNGGQGFGIWWIMRCWIDEYIAWYFELSGYFQSDFDVRNMIDNEMRENFTNTGPQHQFSTSLEQSPKAQLTTEVNFDDATSFDLLTGEPSLQFASSARQYCN